MEDAVPHRTLSTTTDGSGCCWAREEGGDDAFVVDVLYGPTCVCGVVKHRVGWVKGVRDALRRLRFRVNLRRVSDPGTVAFAFEGRVVFACAARNLSFGGCATVDPTADAAVRTLTAERDRAVAAELRRSRLAGALPTTTTTTTTADDGFVGFFGRENE